SENSRMRIFPILLLLLAFASFAAAQNTADVPKPETDRVEDVYLARDDGEGKAGDVVKSFEVTDVPIHCIVMLREALPASVKMELVAVKVAGVKPESRVVTAAYTTSQGQDRVFFLGRPQ